MATFTYTVNIPNPPNNPSSDVPNMQTNTNSIDDIINEDHFSFGQDDKDGKHKQTRLVAGSLPAGLIAGEGTLYTKTINGQNQLFYTRDNSGLEIQMSTTGITPNVIIPVYTPALTGSIPDPSINLAYVTFLPGNSVLISGQCGLVAASQQVTFSFNISNIYSVQIIRLATEVSNPSNRSFHQVTSLGATPGSFTFRSLDDGGTPKAGYKVMWQVFGVL